MAFRSICSDHTEMGKTSGKYKEAGRRSQEPGYTMTTGGGTLGATLRDWEVTREVSFR